MTATIGSFKGHPTITLAQQAQGTQPEGRGFTFGIAKARLILDHYASIQEFVRIHGGTDGTTTDGVALREQA
jgi:hypothetical protein